jgi:non-ribosomal peptide synthetase component F
MVVALLGILKAGGAYLPLEVNLPCARLAVVLKDSGARLLLTEQSDLAERLVKETGGGLDPESVKVIVLAPDCLELRAPAAAYGKGCINQGGSKAAGPSDPAYVIYTSGSTGTPKGVVIKHQGEPPSNVP